MPKIHSLQPTSCGKRGHFDKVCRSSKLNSIQLEEYSVPVNGVPILAAISNGLSKAMIKSKVNGIVFDTLIDSGSTNSFIVEELLPQVQHKVVKEHIKLTIKGINNLKTVSTLFDSISLYMSLYVTTCLLVSTYIECFQ